MNAAEIRRLVKRNPFRGRHTLGFFYGEKIRAIGSVVPDAALAEVIEVGGGTSGLTSILFPGARVVNVDCDPQVLEWAAWSQTSTEVAPGVATDLPFSSASVDCVTMFDVLEHVPDDRAAAHEALRVLRPGGFAIISSPSGSWRYPFYRTGLGRMFYSEEEIMGQWGHVRRGYSAEQLRDLFPGCELVATADYMNPLTVIAHDISFSRLSAKMKCALIVAQYPFTLIGYSFGCPGPRMGIAVTLRKVSDDGD